MQFLVYLISISALLLMTACNNNSAVGKQRNDTAAIESHEVNVLPAVTAFQDTIDGKKTNLFVLKNNSIAVAVTNYGARVVSLLVADKEGKLVDVVLGFDNLASYTAGPNNYFGAVVGRYANRIAKGKFLLNGNSVQLSVNNGIHHIHGGIKGFSQRVWDAQIIGDTSLFLSYFSPGGEEGYPGNVATKVVYTATAHGSLKIDYEATTDKPTVINLTNHSFFNLNGLGSGTIDRHLLYINADNYTPVDATLIPDGIIKPVTKSPFDFRTTTSIGARINDTANMQIKFGHGYDHNFVLNKSEQTGLIKAAVVTGDKTGITMTVYTLEPGMQFYSGNFMKGDRVLKGGKKNDCRTAFCLETQHFPNSPNQPLFPSTVLEPGQVYKTKTVYCFSTKN